MISCLIFSNPISTPWLLFAVYEPVRSAEKRVFWENLHMSVDRFSGGWLVLGDFNGVLYQSNRHGGRESASSSVHMIKALDYSGLVEIPSTRLKYTWSNGRIDDLVIRAKLDRGVANSEWWDLFPNADIKIHPSLSSNHSPILLNSNGNANFIQRPFRFKAI
ncbi:hypothetical protein UlMin_010741 [Ulmus minor]